MEATGVYWMHVYELLEGVTNPSVVNAAHVKKVPGRKTDMNDAEWLAELHAHGLLRLSFVPPKEIRELRAVARYRTKLIAIRTSARNRTIKLIEMAGVKLSSVVSDSFGKTGRAILNVLAEGKATLDQPSIAALAKGSLCKKVDELTRAVLHPLTDKQRELLKLHLHLFDMIDAQVAQVELRLFELAQPYQTQIDLLDQIPGIKPLSAITVLAETGLDMSVYRDERHLSALAGLAPGNAISADKRRKISVRAGNRYLKRIMVQIAWAASRTKDSFQRLRFLRLSRRIGRNKAIVAVARQMLVIVYHVLSSGQPYVDRGMDFYDRHEKEKSVARHTRRLNALGYLVELTKKDGSTE
jgi:transposase